jgi:nucleotide-binding universal stress UspA family protein
MRAWKANIFNRILVAVDGSNSARKAAILAVRLAKRNASELIVATVAPPPRYISSSRQDLEHLLNNYDATRSKESEKWVSDIVDMAKSHGVNARGYVRKSSSVVRSITEFGEQLGVDLIVLGTRGQSGIKTLLLRSVSKDVVSHAPCAVLVVR